ncbi:MAG: hypothetical protein LBC82_00325 [Oscillospiraceae bacterium]|jgi:hypothetical protein|nr:hypothetical protein [Oscillospiraceae bacterium]
MLKGVNKLIIEVSNPESDFFERAIFFVKPEKSDTATRDLNDNVRTLVGRAEAASKAGKLKTKKPRPKKHTLLKFAGAAGTGAAVTGVLMKLIG